MLKVLANRCRWLDPSDREAIMHDAYAVFLEKQRDGKLDVEAMQPAQVRAYLTQTALNKAMDEGKRASRRSLSLDDERLGLEPPDPQRDLGEGLASRFDDARVREIVAELPERQQTVIKLRFFFGRSPQEIQRYLGVTERVYRRELERATRHIAERFELVRHGGFCESRRSLILAYVSGIAGPTRAAEARRHLDTCPACSHWALELRAASRRSAAVLPLPLPAFPVAGALLGRAAAATRGARQRTADLGVTARGHATRVFVYLDPSKATVLSAARPGAAAMVVVGCLAAGSTASYCVVHGVPAPIRSLLGESPPRRDHVREARRVSTSPASSAARLAVPIMTAAPAARSADGVPVVDSPPRNSHSRTRSSSGNGSAGSGLGRTHPSQQASNAEFGFENRIPAASPTSPPPSSSASASEFGFEGRDATASSSSLSTHSSSGSESHGSSPSTQTSSVKRSTPNPSSALAEFGP